MNIDGLKAGEELDKLIAEKVMGLEVRRSKDCKELDWACSSFGPYTPPYIVRNLKGEEWWIPNQGPLSSYSTSIFAAWAVVFKFNYVYLFHSDKAIPPHMKKGQWECKFTPKDGREFYAVADTAPLAICLAALKVIE